MKEHQNFIRKRFILIDIKNEFEEYTSKISAEEALLRKKERAFALVKVSSGGSSINTELLNNPCFNIDGTKNSAKSFIEKTFGDQLRNAADNARELASGKVCV